MTHLTSHQNRHYGLLVAILLGGAAVAQACGGDANPVPSPPIIGSGGSSASGGSGGSNGGKGGNGGSGNSNAEGGAANEGGGGNVETGGTGGGSTGGSGGSTGGSGGNGGSTGGSGGSTGGSGGSTGGTGGSTGGSGGSTGGSAGTGGSSVDCDERGDLDCYQCAPEAADPAPAFPHSSNEQFLNRCSDADCSSFDNAGRIPGFIDTDHLPSL